MVIFQSNMAKLTKKLLLDILSGNVPVCSVSKQEHFPKRSFIGGLWNVKSVAVGDSTDLYLDPELDEEEKKDESLVRERVLASVNIDVLSTIFSLRKIPESEWDRYTKIIVGQEFYYFNALISPGGWRFWNIFISSTLDEIRLGIIDLFKDGLLSEYILGFEKYEIGLVDDKKIHHHISMNERTKVSINGKNLEDASDDIEIMDGIGYEYDTFESKTVDNVTTMTIKFIDQSITVKVEIDLKGVPDQIFPKNLKDKYHLETDGDFLELNYGLNVLE